MSTFSRCGNCNQKINRVLFSLRITNVCKVKRFHSTWYQEISIFQWHTLYFKCFVNKIHIQVGNNNGMSPYNFHVKRESASKSRFDFHISECTCMCVTVTVIYMYMYFLFLLCKKGYITIFFFFLHFWCQVSEYISILTFMSYEIKGQGTVQ